MISYYSQVILSERNWFLDQIIKIVYNEGCNSLDLHGQDRVSSFSVNSFFKESAPLMVRSGQIACESTLIFRPFCRGGGNFHCTLLNGQLVMPNCLSQVMISHLDTASVQQVTYFQRGYSICKFGQFSCCPCLDSPKIYVLKRF